MSYLRAGEPNLSHSGLGSMNRSFSSALPTPTAGTAPKDTPKGAALTPPDSADFVAIDGAVLAAIKGAVIARPRTQPMLFFICFAANSLIFNSFKVDLRFIYFRGKSRCQILGLYTGNYGSV